MSNIESLNLEDWLLNPEYCLFPNIDPLLSPVSPLSEDMSNTSTAPVPTTSRANLLCSNIGEGLSQEKKQEDNNDKRDINVCTTSKVNEHVQVEQKVEDRMEPQEKNEEEVKDEMDNQIRRIYMCYESHCSAMYNTRRKLDRHMKDTHGKTGLSCNARTCTANHCRDILRDKDKSKCNILTRLICKNCGRGYRIERFYYTHISKCRNLGKEEKEFMLDLQNKHENLQYFSQESLSFILKWVEDATSQTTKMD